MFSLVVDDIVTNFTSEENAQHLVQALKDKYEILVDQNTIPC